MNPKQIDLSCPCCGTQLTVDVLTATVLRSAQPRGRDETGKPILDEGRWDQAAERVRERSTTRSDALDSALEKERGRDGDLEDLFEKARRKVRKPPED